MGVILTAPALVSNVSDERDAQIASDAQTKAMTTAFMVAIVPQAVQIAHRLTRCIDIIWLTHAYHSANFPVRRGGPSIRQNQAQHPPAVGRQLGMVTCQLL